MSGRGRKKINKSLGYFGEQEEAAVKEFLDPSTCEARKNELFSKYIEIAFRKLVQGILTMPKFQKMIGVFKDFDCEEGAYYHLIFNMHKFDPSRLGKDGNPAKVYSYYGTTVKNYILALKIQADRQIADIGGIKEISEVSEEIKCDKKDIKIFEELRYQITKLLEEISSDTKLTKNDVIVVNCLKYMLDNWHKLDFQSKNQFNRLLVSYTQLPSNTVMNSLKKIKMSVNNNPNLTISED